jgi:hypothetical protein
VIRAPSRAQEDAVTELNANSRHDARPQRRPGSASQAPSRQTWRYAVAGLSASLVGLGLTRFSYTPLIPALIAALTARKA